jgi:hypothetical protein
MKNTPNNEILFYMYIINTGILFIIICIFMSNILSKSILTYLNYISFNINELLSLTLIYFEDKIALNINGLLKPTLVGFNYVYNIISEFLLSINTIISEFLLFIYNIPFYNIPFYYIYVAIIFSTII